MRRLVSMVVLIVVVVGIAVAGIQGWNYVSTVRDSGRLGGVVVVPATYTPVIRAAAERCPQVPVRILAAQIAAESSLDPSAISPAGAQGIAQFMPGTARGMGVRDPFDPAQAIPGSARLIASGIREFGSVPLALAAYNAGGGAVRRYGGIPPYAETQAYVARVMALAGQGAALVGGGSGVVLVRAGELLA